MRGWNQIVERPHAHSFPLPEEFKQDGKWPWDGSIWECDCGKEFVFKPVEQVLVGCSIHTESYFGRTWGFFPLTENRQPSTIRFIEST
jgi:hypothetical protein